MDSLTLAELATAATTAGFPVVVSLYLLMRVTKQIDTIASKLEVIAVKVETLSATVTRLDAQKKD